MLLLHTTGAKTGQARVNPMMYLEDNGILHVFASKAGAPTNPDWYHNLIAHPEVTIELGTEKFKATARALGGEERARVYARQAELYPGFKEYEEKTSRVIPVIALDRA
jgi:deazaflavin-dependent oxidoreductase (nitroreductase family)